MPSASDDPKSACKGQLDDETDDADDDGARSWCD
jgi:hypothetical protein